MFCCNNEQVAEDSGLPVKTIQRASHFLDILSTKSMTGDHRAHTADRDEQEGMGSIIIGAVRNQSNGVVSLSQCVDSGDHQLLEAETTERLESNPETKGGEGVPKLTVEGETLERNIQNPNGFVCLPAGQPAASGSKGMNVWAGRRVSNVEEGIVMEVFENCARKAWQALASTSSASPQASAVNGMIEAAGGSAAECDAKGQVQEGREDRSHSWIQSFYVRPG